MPNDALFPQRRQRAQMPATVIDCLGQHLPSTAPQRTTMDTRDVGQVAGRAQGRLHVIGTRLRPTEYVSVS
jgi:hypothetical protein